MGRWEDPVPYLAVSSAAVSRSVFHITSEIFRTHICLVASEAAKIQAIALALQARWWSSAACRWLRNWGR